MSAVTAPVGRRETNKAHTRQALIDAVYAILIRDGEEGLTAEKVADAANVSRRTFFNYFPSVDAAIAARVKDTYAGLAEALLERPVDESLVDSAVAVVERTLHLDALIDAAAAWRACEKSPAAKRYILELVEDSAAELTKGWVKSRVAARDRSELYVPVLTAATFAAFDVARQQWLARTPGPIDAAAHADFLASVHEAFELLRPSVETAGVIDPGTKGNA